MGRTISGRYELLGKLGSGGMGTVYKARHVDLGSLHALKVLPEQSVEDPVAVARFEREAKIQARLHHDHIVKTTDLAREGNLYYLVQEYIEGEDLSRRIKRLGALDELEALSIARDIGEALEYAHESSVIHRDIKPQNVMTRDGRSGLEILVTDFGIATESDASVGLTQPGLMVGSYRYSAPEQLGYRPEGVFDDSEEVEVDARADIYSLGLVLYEMLEGRPPFENLKMRQLIARVALDDKPIHLDFRQSVSPEVRELVEIAVERERAHRPADMREYLGMINRCLSDLDGAGDGTMAMPVRGAHTSSDSGEITRDDTGSLSGDTGSLSRPRRRAEASEARCRSAYEAARRAGAVAAAADLYQEALGYQTDGSTQLGRENYDLAVAFFDQAKRTFDAARKEAEQRQQSAAALEAKAEMQEALDEATAAGGADLSSAIHASAVRSSEVAQERFDAGDYADARDLFAEARLLFAESKARAGEALRQREVEGVRDRATVAREQATGAKADEWVPDAFLEAEEARLGAQERLDRGDFTAAATGFERAVAAFEQAAADAAERERQSRVQEEVSGAMAAREQAIQALAERWAEPELATADEAYGEARGRPSDDELEEVLAALRRSAELFLVAAAQAEARRGEARARARDAARAAERARDAADAPDLRPYAEEEFAAADGLWAEAGVQVAEEEFDAAVETYARARAAFERCVDVAVAAAKEAAARDAARAAARGRAEAARDRAVAAGAETRATERFEEASREFEAAAGLDAVDACSMLEAATVGFEESQEAAVAAAAAEETARSAARAREAVSAAGELAGEGEVADELLRLESLLGEGQECAAAHQHEDARGRFAEAERAAVELARSLRSDVENAVAEAEESLRAAAESRCDVFAPDAYQRATQAFAEAREGVERDVAREDSLAAIARVRELVLEAEESSRAWQEESSQLLDGVEGARSLAEEGGAPRLAEEAFAAASELAVEARSAVESGRVVDAREALSAAVSGFEGAAQAALEVRVRDARGDAEEQWQAAEEVEAARYADAAFSEALGLFERASGIEGTDSEESIRLFERAAEGFRDARDGAEEATRALPLPGVEESDDPAEGLEAEADPDETAIQPRPALEDLEGGEEERTQILRRVPTPVEPVAERETSRRAEAVAPEEPSAPSRMPAYLGGAAALVVLAVVGGYLFLGSQRDEAPVTAKRDLPPPQEEVVARVETKSEPEAADRPVERTQEVPGPVAARPPAPGLRGIRPAGRAVSVQEGQREDFAVEVSNPEDASAVEWALDGQVIASGSTEWSYEPGFDSSSGDAVRRSVEARLPGTEGAHEWEVRVENVNRAPALVDATPATGADVDATVGDSVSFRVAASDPDEDSLTYSWSVDGAPVEVEGPTLDFPVSAEGEFRVKVEVTDVLGSSVDGEWRVAALKKLPAAPVLTASPAKLSNLGYGKSQRFAIEGAPSGEGFEWKVDGVRVGDGSSYTFKASDASQIRDKPVQLAVRSTGEASFSHVWSFRIRPPAPRIEEQSPSAKTVSLGPSERHTFRLAAAKPLGGQAISYVFEVDGRRKASGKESSFSFEQPDAKPHTIRGYAIDGAKQRSAAVEWRIKPATSVTARAKAWLAEYEKAFNQKDADRIAQLRGLDSAAREKLRAAMASKEGLTVQFEDIEIQKVSDDSARVSYRRTESFRSKGKQHRPVVEVEQVLKSSGGRMTLVSTKGR